MEWKRIPEEQLVLKVRGGSTEAFVELASRYVDVIRAKTAPYHSFSLEAEDLCQEGFLALLNAAKTYDAEKNSSFATYARTCIENRIISAYRKASGKKQSPLNNFISLTDENDCALKAQLTSQMVTDPEALLIYRENLEVVKKRIQHNLSKLEQTVLSYYVSGYSYKEIAHILAISEKAADNAIQRARRKLKSSVLI